MRRTNKITANYSHCVERGDSLQIYYQMVDANEDPIYIGHYDLSLILKPARRSSEVLHRWNTSKSFDDVNGIFLMSPPESGNFKVVFTDDFTESMSFDEVYYNIEVTSASTENEILDGGIRFVMEHQ